MKKKLMLTVLSSVFALGVLGACGDMEDNDGFNDAPVDNAPADNGMDDDGGNNDF